MNCLSDANLLNSFDPLSTKSFLYMCLYMYCGLRCGKGSAFSF
jgi:hypothetical protein